MKRLDAYLCERGEYPSRTKAAEAIKRGEILLCGKVCDKPSALVTGDSVIEIIKPQAFVSNGGFKLEKALNDFSVEITGNFVDIGASTGGFTDCLLKRGAKFVYAVDVGESQLSPSLSKDERVFVMDKINARTLKKSDFDREINGVVCDVSFISLTYILPIISDILSDSGVAITLIKPQFECGKRALNSNGIVKSRADRLSAVKKIYDFGVFIGLTPVNFTVAPVREGKNTEYLMLWQKNCDKAVGFEKIISGVI